MNKKILILFSVVMVIAMAGFVVAEAYTQQAEGITGSWGMPKFVKKAAHAVKKEVKKAEKKIEKKAEQAVKTVEKTAKKAAKRVGTEAQQFGKKVGNEVENLVQDAEKIKDLPDKVKGLPSKLESEIKKTPGRITGLPGKVKAEIEQWAKNPEKVYKDTIHKVKREIDAQSDTIRNLAQGKVCAAYNHAQESGVYDSQIKRFISHDLLPPIKTTVRPHIAVIVASVAAPINALPVVGQAVYIVVVPAATEWGTDYAAKKAIKEALKRCD